MLRFPEDSQRVEVAVRMSCTHGMLLMLRPIDCEIKQPRSNVTLDVRFVPFPTNARRPNACVTERKSNNSSLNLVVDHWQRDGLAETRGVNVF